MMICAGFFYITRIWRALGSQDIWSSFIIVDPQTETYKGLF